MPEEIHKSAHLIALMLDEELFTMEVDKAFPSATLIRRLRMLDVELAKFRLKEKDFTLVIVKAGQIVFETRLHGIEGLLQAIERLNEELVGCSVADRVVGRAAAMLCVYSQVAHVFVMLLSREGKRVFEENNVSYKYERLVPNVLNYNRDEVCPFEKLVAKIKNPEEAYRELKLFKKS